MRLNVLLATAVVLAGVSDAACGQTRLQNAMTAYVKCMNDLAIRYDDHHSDADTIANRFEASCRAELQEQIDAEIAQNPTLGSVRGQIEQDNLNVRHHAARMAVLMERAGR
jgi:hypothetical protein